MKKTLVILMIVLLFSGCQRIDNLSPKEAVDIAISENSTSYNQYRTVYKYYLPSGMKIENNIDFNEKLSTKDTDIYLFIDLISYYNKKKVNYKKNENAYFSMAINKDNKEGYVEITKKDDNFYVEMIYNYAKIELITNEYNMVDNIYKSMRLLSSIKYNNSIVENLMGDNVLEFSESTYSVFKPRENVDNFLDYVEEYNTYNGPKEDIPDYDVIN